MGNNYPEITLTIFIYLLITQPAASFNLPSMFNVQCSISEIDHRVVGKLMYDNI